MAVSRQARKAWEKKFDSVNEARDKASDDWHVLIHEAREAGLSQSDVAYMAVDVSPSGVKAKEDQGRAILERRRGSKGGSSTS